MGAYTSSCPRHTSLVFGLCSSQFSRRVYYYFYEGTRKFILKARSGSKGLSTLESMLAGLIAGSATTVISNPIWVVQTTQAVYSMSTENAEGAEAKEERPGYDAYVGRLHGGCRCPAAAMSNDDPCADNSSSAS